MWLDVTARKQGGQGAASAVVQLEAPGDPCFRVVCMYKGFAVDPAEDTNA